MQNPPIPTVLFDIRHKSSGIRPMNITDTIEKIIPASALLGAGIGGISGAVKPDKYDENGNKKSKLKEIILSSILGAGVGTVAGAAVPVGTRMLLDAKGNIAEMGGNILGNPRMERIGQSTRMLAGSPLAPYIPAKDVLKILSTF